MPGTGSGEARVHRRRRKPTVGCRHEVCSDLGRLYLSDYRAGPVEPPCRWVCAPSMGSVGDAYDHALAESLFTSLERELIDRRIAGSVGSRRPNSNGDTLLDHTPIPLRRSPLKPLERQPVHHTGGSTLSASRLLDQKSSGRSWLRNQPMAASGENRAAIGVVPIALAADNVNRPASRGKSGRPFVG
jgi:hypothetical protein